MKEREREEDNGCEKVERIARKRTVIKKDQARKGIRTKRRICETRKQREGDEQICKSHPNFGRQRERKKQREGENDKEFVKGRESEREKQTEKERQREIDR